MRKAAPGPALLLEGLATLLQLGTVYACLASARFREWTAVVACVLLTVVIVLLAQVSDAGFNPVRAHPAH
jgi:hypothetical protein